MPIAKNPDPGSPISQLLSKAKSFRLTGDAYAAEAILMAERRDENYRKAEAILMAERRDENYRKAEEFERAARILSDGLNVDPQTAAEIKRKTTYV